MTIEINMPSHGHKANELDSVGGLTHLSVVKNYPPFTTLLAPPWGRIASVDSSNSWVLARVFILEVGHLKFYYHQERAFVYPPDNPRTFGTLVVLVSNVRDVLQESIIILTFTSCWVGHMWINSMTFSMVLRVIVMILAVYKIV